MIVNAYKNSTILRQQLVQQLQPRIHHAQPFIMPGQVLALPANHLAQPLFDPRVVHIVVVDPALIARIIRRINIDTLDLSLVPGQQGLERIKIVTSDNHVLACFGVVCILLLQHPVGDFLVVVDDLAFPDPFKSGHNHFLHKDNIASAFF